MRNERSQKRKSGRQRMSGQGMTEYLMLIAFFILPLIGMMTFFLENIGYFYKNILSVVSVPFP